MWLHTGIEYGAFSQLERLEIAPVALDGGVYGDNKGGARLRVLNTTGVGEEQLVFGSMIEENDIGKALA